MYSRESALSVVTFEPSGLKVSSFLLLVLKSAYSLVANKLVALAPMAKTTATANVPMILGNAFKSFSLTNLYKKYTENTNKNSNK